MGTTTAKRRTARGAAATPPSGPATPPAPVAPARLTDALSWDGDRLVVDGGATGNSDAARAALVKLDRPRLSPSTSFSVRKCPARMVIDRLMPYTEDPFGAAETGTSTHAVFEDLFALPSAERTLSSAERLLLDLHTRRTDVAAPDPTSPTFPEDLERWRSLIRHMVSGLWEIENPSEVMVAATELNLNNVEVAGVPFVGFVDRVDIAADRRGRAGRKIVDYKSGRVPKVYRNAKFRDDHKDQVVLYALATSKLDNDRLPIAGALYYVTHRVVHEVDLSRDELTIVERDFAHAWDDVKTYAREAAYPAKSSPLCGWCPLATVCPVARRDGKDTPKVDGAHAGELLAIRTVRALDDAMVPVPDLPSSTAGDAATDAATDVPVDADTDTKADSDTDSDAHADSGTVPAEEDTTPRDPDADGATPDSMSSDSMSSATDRSGAVGDPARPPLNPATAKNGAMDMSEARPWEETTGSGGLNPSSYAATAVFGIVELAVEELHRAGEPLTPTAVKAFSATLATVVLDTQETEFGSSSWQDGSNTRIRGALRTVLVTLPPPFGQDAAAWEAWVTKATRRTRSITAAAVELWDRVPAEPWLALADATNDAA